MKRAYYIVFSTIILSAHVLLQGAFLQQLTQAQEARGIRVTIPEDIEFKNKTGNLSMQIATGPQLINISQDNAEQISRELAAFYSLFFDPTFIRFSTKEVMNDFFEQLKNWHDALKAKNITLPWLSGANGLKLKNLLVQALKEICLFGRYTKHREENLVTFKLRLQYILTSIMMDSYLEQWKDQLVIHNEQMSLGSFYSWDVDLIKSEFKDSAALTQLFRKLSTTINKDAEQQAEQRHAQELAIEKQQIAERKQKDAQLLQSIVLEVQQQSPTDDAGRGLLYLDCVRVLLDPAYMDVSPTDRKAIDKINDQFKNLHAIIGRTFMPIMSQESIDTLKLLVAKALETISSSAAIGKAGGVAFKNHVEFVLKTLMTIIPKQTLIENQIKFQWIKPLYLDNQFLTGDLKKKCLDKFNSSDFQRWQAGIRNFTLKISSPIEPIVPVSIPMVSPVVPVQMPVVENPSEKNQVPEEIVETLTLPDIRKRPLPKIPQPQPVATSTITKQVPEKAATVQRSIPAPATSVTASTDLSQVSKKLIAQSLVAPVSTIKNILVTVEPNQKFDLVGMQDDTLYTAVHQAASLGRADVLKMLLEGLNRDQRFAIVKLRERDGQTALYLAAAAKSAPTKGFKPMEAIKELLDGLTLDQQIELINTPDNDGITPLDIAQSSNNKAIVALFKEILKKGGR